MTITAEQFERLRLAAAAGDKTAFEQLLLAIVRQSVRDICARREAGRPPRRWLPEYV